MHTMILNSVPENMDRSRGTGARDGFVKMVEIRLSRSRNSAQPKHINTKHLNHRNYSTGTTPPTEHTRWRYIKTPTTNCRSKTRASRNAAGRELSPDPLTPLFRPQFPLHPIPTTGLRQLARAGQSDHPREDGR